MLGCLVLASPRRPRSAGCRGIPIDPPHVPVRAQSRAAVLPLSEGADTVGRQPRRWRHPVLPGAASLEPDGG